MILSVHHHGSVAPDWRRWLHADDAAGSLLYPVLYSGCSHSTASPAIPAGREESGRYVSMSVP
jgi:hypothetical protein